ncbi:MAG TPA: hypothetical protein IGS40_18890 [Trichormus sp. M33_DOE_039]|nr:hypothetical protein [Trichormus sp. M33_DOE_039]
MIIRYHVLKHFSSIYKKFNASDRHQVIGATSQYGYAALPLQNLDIPKAVTTLGKK